MKPKEYLTDGLGRLRAEAAALIFPLSTQEVSGILLYAHANRIPVTPRGAGTNLVGSTVPLKGGMILERQGFFYPPDPGEKAASIGGNISTNAGGMRAAMNRIENALDPLHILNDRKSYISGRTENAEIV